LIGTKRTAEMFGIVYNGSQKVASPSPAGYILRRRLAAYASINPQSFAK
jgi:phage FluMu protein gp41